jgi:hypothetical protein
VLEHVTVTRYVTPLREGGSLPAIVEADNLGTNVMKFRVSVTLAALVPPVSFLPHQCAVPLTSAVDLLRFRG